MGIFLNILSLVLLIIALLFLLVFFLVVKVHFKYDTDTGNFELFIKALFFKYKIFPQNKKKIKKAKKHKKENNKEKKKQALVITDEDLKKIEEDAKGASEKTETKEKKSFSERVKHFINLVKTITEKVKILTPAVFSALKLEIRHLDIVVGAEDAAKTAISYGALCAAIDGLYAVGKESGGLVVGKKVFIGVDYLKEKFSAEMELVLNIRISKLIIPVLKVLFM